MGRIRWPPLKRVIENMVKRDRHHRWKIDQIVEELSKFERDMSAQSKRESIPISLPLIFDDLNLSAKFKKEYRIDLGKKSV
jgi:rubrerythrin